MNSYDHTKNQVVIESAKTRRFRVYYELKKQDAS